MFLAMALTFVGSLAVAAWLRIGRDRPVRFAGRADAGLFALALAVAIQGWGENNAGRPAIDVAIGFFLVGLIGMAYFVSGEVRGPEGTDKESK